MRLRGIVLLAFATGLSFMAFRGGASPRWTRDLQVKEAFIASANNRETGGSVKADDPISSSPNNARSSSNPSALRFACDPRSHGITQYNGGTVAYCTKKDLEISPSDAAIIEIRPGAARAPHWHDTWEQQVLISGEAKTYLIDEKGQVHEEVLTQGMVAVLPAGMTHWTETIGDQPAVLLLSFAAGFKTFELGDSLVQVRRSDRRCTPGSTQTACTTKRKDVILILKDGLL
jgi:hypothetical protein